MEGLEEEAEILHADLNALQDEVEKSLRNMQDTPSTSIRAIEDASKKVRRVLGGRKEYIFITSPMHVSSLVLKLTFADIFHLSLSLSVCFLFVGWLDQWEDRQGEGTAARAGGFV